MTPRSRSGRDAGVSPGGGAPVQLPLFEAGAGATLSQRIKAWLTGTPGEPRTHAAEAPTLPGSTWPDSFFDADPPA